MKILFFGIPAFGHINPTLPIVSELVRRGHTVVYYNTPSFASLIETAGAQFRAYPNADYIEDELHRRINNLPTVTVFLLEEDKRLLPFALDQIEIDRPDMILFDALAIWGMQAARFKGIPSVSSITTIVWEGVKGTVNIRDGINLARFALPHIGALLRARKAIVDAFGKSAFPNSALIPSIGDKTIVYTSRELQPITPFIDPSFYFVGTSTLSSTRAQTNFPWEDLQPGKPKIYVSLGTLYHENTLFLHSIFEAFSDHPAQVIFSTGTKVDLASVGPVPENFIIRPTVPQLELLPRVDLFISHGGLNSLSESLYFGVPLVVIPQQLEQALNGRLAAEKGAAVVLGDHPPYGKVAALALRSAADRVLSDPNFKKTAEHLGISLKNAGGYKRAADIILEKSR